MPRLMMFALACLLALTAFAQPGLCPCWLIADVAAFHPHTPDQLGHAHSHEYLRENYPAQVVATLPAALLPAAVFITFLASRPHWRRLAGPAFAAVGWLLPVDAPPPRLRLLAPAALAAAPLR